MLQKIAAFLLVLLLIQLALFANTSLEQISNVGTPVSEKMIKADKNDNDVVTLLASLGIVTVVDEDKLDEKYPSTMIHQNPENGNAIVEFNNPEEKYFRLDVYDMNKGLVASYANISSNQIIIQRDLFKIGAYIYKLAGDSKMECGTFMLR